MTRRMLEGRVGGDESGRPAVWRWMTVLLLVSLPLVTAVRMHGGTVIDHSIVLYSLGFVLYGPFAPLWAAALTVPWMSPAVTHRWAVYTRTREPLEVRLRRGAIRAALLPAVVMACGFIVLGAYSFWIAPLLGSAPRGESGAWVSYGSPMSALRHSTMSQLLAGGPFLYVGVMALLEGLWAALFGLAGFVVLSLTGHRILALTVPVIVYWLDNLAWSVAGPVELRAITSVDPFDVVQVSPWALLVPIGIWGFAIAGGLLLVRSRLSRTAGYL